MTKVQFVGANDKKMQVRISLGAFSDKEIFVSPKTAHKLLQGAIINVELGQLKDAAMIAEKQGDTEFLTIVKQIIVKK